MLREELAGARAALEDANSGRSSAEQEAARLCIQVEDWRAFAGAAENGRIKVSAVVPPANRAILRCSSSKQGRYCLFVDTGRAALCLIKRLQPHLAANGASGLLHRPHACNAGDWCHFAAIMTVLVVMTGGANGGCCHGGHGGGPCCGRSGRAARGVADGVPECGGVCVCSSRAQATGLYCSVLLQSQPEPCLTPLPPVSAAPAAVL